jgi:hypothetical protein
MTLAGEGISRSTRAQSIYLGSKLRRGMCQPIGHQELAPGLTLEPEGRSPRILAPKWRLSLALDDRLQ